jgi:hypothetical protein
MSLAKQYTRIFGAIILAIGILGFVPGISSGYADSGLLLGIFAINPLHNVIHILTGLVALFAGLYADGAYARLYALVFGVVYALITVVGFTQLFFVNGDQLLGIVPINTADNFLHLAIAVVALGVYALSAPGMRTAASAS